MIRLTREQFGQLRDGKRLAVPCPARQHAGRAYKVIVGAVIAENGKLEHPRRLQTVTILSKPHPLEAVIGWSDQTDTPLLLHRRSERGYTANPHQAMQGEPEAIPAIVQERYSKEAEGKPRVSQREAWEERRAILQRQLDELRATDTGRQVARDLAAIESRLRSIDRKLAA